MSNPSPYDNQVLHPHRPTGLNGLSRRFELKWVAGQRGKPSINADINSATEATREIADPDFEILGTNAVSADSTFSAEGGITLSSHGADADSTILLPHLDANQSAWTQVTWGTDKETEWQCHLKTASSIATATIWAGLKLTNTSVVATDNDQCFFRYAAADSGYWVVNASIGGVDVSTTTSVAVAASTEVHLRVSIDSSRIARFYIDEVLVYTSGALTNATDFIPYIGVMGVTGSAVKSVVVFGQAISRVLG